MLDYLADPRILGLLFLIFVSTGVAGLVVLYFSARKAKMTEMVTATSDWKATGKIDFHCPETPKDDKAPAAFLLRVEDYRTVESISGVEHVEIRWRNATLAEAKAVVVAHQTAGNSFGKGYEFPSADVSSAAPSVTSSAASTASALSVISSAPSSDGPIETKPSAAGNTPTSRAANG